jgi:hypothetical protein
MSTVEEIEGAIQSLSPDELTRFRTWFAAFDAEVWDREFEEDVDSGRLDQFADEALKDLDEGRCSGL